VLKHFSDAKMLVSCIVGTKNSHKREIIRSSNDYSTDAIINTIIRIAQELPSASAVTIESLSLYINELKNEVENMSIQMILKNEDIEKLKIFN